MVAGTIATFKADGSIGVRTEDANGVVSRHVVVPGAFTDAVTFVGTDLTAEAQAVKDAAVGWTAQVVTAWKAAHPFVPTPAPTTDQQRIAAINANARRQALVAAIQGSDDAALITYMTARITDLPSARTALIDLALLVAAAIRS